MARCLTESSHMEDDRTDQDSCSKWWKKALWFQSEGDLTLAASTGKAILCITYLHQQQMPKKITYIIHAILSCTVPSGPCRAQDECARLNCYGNDDYTQAVAAMKKRDATCRPSGQESCQVTRNKENRLQIMDSNDSNIQWSQICWFIIFFPHVNSDFEVSTSVRQVQTLKWAPWGKRCRERPAKTWKRPGGKPALTSQGCSKLVNHSHQKE